MRFLVVPKKEGLCTRVPVTAVRMVRLCNRLHNSISIEDTGLCVANIGSRDGFGLVFRASLLNLDYGVSRSHGFA